MEISFTNVAYEDELNAFLNCKNLIFKDSKSSVFFFALVKKICACDTLFSLSKMQKYSQLTNY